MASPWHHNSANKKAGLSERNQEFFRLRDGIDYVVLTPVDQQEAGAVLVHRRIAERRSFEEFSAADCWRAAEKLLGDLITRPHNKIVLPLRDHVIDAIDAHDRSHPSLDPGVGIAAIFGAERRFLACQRYKRSQVRAP